MKVSVIIPLFNSYNFLGDAVNSILNQTYNDFNLILVDDFSEDNTLKLAKEYQSKSPKIRVVTNQNEKGISGAMNTGLDLATGDFVAFQDHDDISLPNRLETQVLFLSKNPEVGVCGSWMQEFGQGNSLWKFPTKDEELKALTFLHSPIPNPTAMVRRDILEIYKIRYKTAYDFAQDYEFWVQLLPYTKFAIIPEVLVHYRIHSRNTSTLQANKQFQSWKQALSSLISKLHLKLSEEEIRLIYDMKYPNFWKKYIKNKNSLESLVTKIVNANNKYQVFPKKALEAMFQNKIIKWSHDDNHL